jgi:integrase
MAGTSFRNGRWRIWYVDEHGRRKWATAGRDRKRAEELANQLEHQARLVREGLVETGHRQRQAAAWVKPGFLVDLWCEWLVNKGSTAKHARHQAGACRRLLDDAKVTTVARLDTDAVAAALASLRTRRSARTANHALVALKGFFHWLDDTGRVKEFPKALRALKPTSEEADRRRRRRALTRDEVDRLLAATEAAPDRHVYGHTKSKHSRIPITGPARALLYRLALGTGFRAAELRSLTPDSFRLDSAEPTVTVQAAYAKSGKTAVQPITPDLAERVRAWLAAGNPLPIVPDRTAEMFRADLGAAGIPVETAEGVADFHAIRHTYVSGVVRSGASVKVAQELARHSTPTLTIGRYAHVDDTEKRKALEGEK